MGKKKHPAKTTPPAPTMSLQDIEAEVAATREEGQRRAAYNLTARVRIIKDHQSDAYEAILKIGREETLSIAKEAIQRTIRNSRTATLEEGRREGYEKGAKEGEE